MRLYILILLLLLSQVLSSQTYFSKTHDFGGGNFNEFYVSDTGLVMTNYTYGDWFRMQIVEFDLQGNAKGPSTSISYNHVPYAVATCNACFEPIGRSKVNFISAQTHFDSSSFAYIHFIKYNRNWQRIDTTDYLFKDSLTSQVHKLRLDSDSTLVIVGLTYHFTNGLNNYDLLVAKFDTAFNLIWETRVEDGFQNKEFGYRGKDLLIDPAGNIIIGGKGLYPNGFSGPVAQFENISIIAKFDGQTGQKIWLKELPDAFSANEVMLLPRGDGNYSYVTHIDTRYPRNGLWGKLRFGIITPGGTLLKDTTIGFEMKRWGTESFVRTLSGDYVVAGKTQRFGEYTSYAFKFSEEGDSIWFRDYFTNGDTSDMSWLMHFRELPDSGFIGLGHYFNRDSLPVHAYNWLLRVDKHGCLEPGCEKIGLASPALLKNVKIYPNPSSGRFTLELPETPQKMTVEVYNVKGQRFYSSPLKYRSTEMELEDVPPGMYMLKIIKENSIIYRYKILIQ